MRIAFLTPEYPTEYRTHGRGLGTYLHRMTSVLIQLGHEPEIFVSSQHCTHTFHHNGIRVHRVGSKEQERAPLLRPISSNGKAALLDQLTSYARKNFNYLGWPRSVLATVGDTLNFTTLREARRLAAVLERRDAEAPFSIVQSSDYLATGLFVRHRPNRVHVVRCSSAADLYNSIDDASSKQERFRAYLERLSIKRADLVYAPSHYIAKHFRDTHAMDVRVIRPPKFVEIQPSSLPTVSLPSRFFFHFGQLGKRKGTNLLAQALPLAWKVVPDLTMVWSGPCWDGRQLSYWRTLWGARTEQVQITGPLLKAEVYAILRRADVTVLPSQADNLPNTVIESLMFGIPVIGSRGASIDELITENQNGHLVDLGDMYGLAQALVSMWRGESPVRKGFRWDTAIAEEMRPDRAVADLLAFARSQTSETNRRLTSTASSAS
jgi:glycosyltransferase involved in cell wall biosynthesis